MRHLLFSCFALMLAACAGTPVPVPPPVYYPPVDYGLPGDPANPTQGPFQPNAALYVCPGFVSNAPPSDRTDQIANFNPIIIVGGKVVMASVPANDVCLSSGYGMRRNRLHKGSDYAPRPRGEERRIYTAAPGRVREAGYANGLGYQVLLDHGHGIYTRYAHLKSIDPWVEVGAEIGFGHALGWMGRSGRTTGVHLHFEVLTGDINNPSGSFGLTSNDPLAFPAWAGLDKSM